MRSFLFSLAACALAAPALAQQGQAAPGPSPARAAGADASQTVQLMDAKGQSVGTVQVRQLQHGVVFIVDVKNLAAGPHGFHLHERGVCEAPSFQSAGGHYNPLNKEHGFDSPQGYHAGDLPNIHVTQQGTAMAEFHSMEVTLDQRQGARQPAAAGPFTLLDQDGSAIVIHAKGDDYQSNDSAGERIACGVVKAPS